MNGAKMVSGLLARTGAGAWLRVVALAAMAWGAWELGVWGWDLIGPKPDGPGAVAVVFAFVQAVVAFLTLTGSRLSLAEDTARAPFVCLSEMTDGGREVPLWALLVGPLVLPAEVLVCVLLAVAWVVKGFGAVLCCKVRSKGS